MKRFVIAHKDRLDNGLSGFTMLFSKGDEHSVMGENSKANIILNIQIDSNEEEEIRRKITAYGLKPNKWFTSYDTHLTGKKMKSLLGFSFWRMIFRNAS